MDPETVEAAETIADAVDEPPPTIAVKRKGRPAGSKNKITKADTGGTPEVPPPPPSPDTSMYDALMKRLDEMDGAIERRQAELALGQANAHSKERPARPKKVAMTPTIREEVEPSRFHIVGSPRTATRQLMAHLNEQQREKRSARERLYENFLPL
jgi:hypothetical protein